MTPICYECGRRMRCYRNGKPICITEDPEYQRLYRFHSVDVYVCPGCETKVCVGASAGVESWQEGFAAEIKAAGDDLLRVY